MDGSGAPSEDYSEMVSSYVDQPASRRGLLWLDLHSVFVGRLFVLFQGPPGRVVSPNGGAADPWSGASSYISSLHDAVPPDESDVLGCLLGTLLIMSTRLTVSCLVLWNA